MARRRRGKKKKRARGSSWAKNQHSKEHPNLPKTEQCASERYGGGRESLAEPEATEVKVAPLRLHWSQL